MILTTHALIGSVLGKNIGNPWILIPAALALHFAMDHFRHGEYVESFDSKTSFANTWWKVSFDIGTSMIIISFFIFSSDLYLAQIRNILIGSFFSAFPDFLTVLHWKFKFKFLAPIYRFHSWCHKYPGGSKERLWTFRNSLNDIIFSLAAIILFLVF